MRKIICFVILCLVAFTTVVDAVPTDGFRGIYNTAPAARWEDAFLSGNGDSGVMIYGEPLDETIIFNSHKFIRPNDNWYIPPDMSPVFESSRDQMLAGDIYGGWSNYYAYAAGVMGKTDILERSQTFHPGYNLKIRHSADGTVQNYHHICNYETGEVIVEWDDHRGSWTRKTFVSRDEDMIVTLLEKPTGALLDCTLSLEATTNHPGVYPYETLNSPDFLNFRCKYNVVAGKQGGYEGVTRVIANGADANVYFSGGDTNVGYVFALDTPIVETADTAALDLTDAVSLEAWIKTETLPAGGARIMDKSVRNTSDGYMLDTYPGNSLRMITAGGNLSYGANLSNEWTHVAAVFSYSQGIQKLYVNGSEVASRTPSAPLTTTDVPLRFGSDSAGGNKFQGMMKRVTVYNRVLSPTEVANLAAVQDMSSLDLSGRVGDWDLDGVVNNQVVSSAPGGLIVTGISSGNTDDLIIEDADSVLLLTKLERYKDDFSGWTNLTLQTELSAITKNYDQLLADHVAIHSQMYNRVTYDLDAPQEDRDLPVATLVNNQYTNTSELDLALVEKVFDTSRYLFMCSSGTNYGPRLSGVFLGDWNSAAWDDDYVVNVNYTLQIGGGNIANLAECMEGPFKVMERTKPDWQAGASNLFGCRGIVGPVRMDGERALFTNMSDFYAHCGSTGYGAWLTYSMYEHYLITGDETFLQNRVYPFLHDMAVFYEDFLSRTNANGDVIFVPSVSPENSTVSGTIASINSTFDIAACKHALNMAIETANILGVEQGAGEGVERWTALKDKLPAYMTEPDGTLKEWAWNFNESYNHRHTSHGYTVWPAYEINPEDPATSGLVSAMQMAIDKRPVAASQPNAHGNLMLLYCEARTKRADKFSDRLLGLFTNEHFYNSLATSHNWHLDIYNYDFINSIQGILIESAIMTQPGIIELLPATPARFAKGKLTGIKGRNRTTINNLEWDLNAGSVTCTFTSDITQDLQLIYRDGISAIACNAPISGSGIYRTVSATAGVPVTVLINAGAQGPGANLIQNPSFEEDDDSNGRPDNWGDDPDYTRSSESVNTGSYAVKGAGDGSIGGISQTVNLETNTDYSLSVNIYYASGTGTVVFDTNDTFDDQGCQTTLYEPNGQWTLYEKSFNSGTNTSVKLRTYTSGLTNGVFYVDDVSLTGPGESSGYETWAALNGVTGTITDDDDGDGRSNFYEYALNGHPTFAGEDGEEPFFTKAGGLFNYIHLQRNDDTNLTYEVLACTNLVTGHWTPIDSITGTNVMGAGFYYNVVTNSISMVDPKTYILLQIRNN